MDAFRHPSLLLSLFLPPQMRTVGSLCVYVYVCARVCLGGTVCCTVASWSCFNSKAHTETSINTSMVQSCLNTWPLWQHFDKLYCYQGHARCGSDMSNCGLGWGVTKPCRGWEGPSLGGNTVMLYNDKWWHWILTTGEGTDSRFRIGIYLQYMVKSMQPPCPDTWLYFWSGCVILGLVSGPQCQWGKVLKL